MHLLPTSRVRSCLFEWSVPWWSVQSVPNLCLVSVLFCVRNRKKGPLRRMAEATGKLREERKQNRTDPVPPPPPNHIQISKSRQQRGNLFLRLLCCIVILLPHQFLKRVNPTPLFEQKQHKSVVLERPPKSSEQNFPSEHDQYTHANTQTPHDESRADSCSSGIVVACLFPSVIICIVP